MTSILDAIGNTPLVRLRRCVPANGAELWIKLEYRNPTGSMKDRMALAMIEGAERDGLISPGDTIVEYTGGSTGPALALVCRAKGYRALIVMADCFTEERFQLMRALGAELDIVPSVEGRPKVTPQDTIEQCMQLMSAKNIRYLPVYEAEELSGIISINDVVKETILVQQETISQLKDYLHASF